MRYCEHRLPGVTQHCNHEATWWVSVNGLVGTAACQKHLSVIAREMSENGTLTLILEYIRKT